MTEITMKYLNRPVRLIITDFSIVNLTGRRTRRTETLFYIIYSSIYTYKSLLNQCFTNTSQRPKIVVFNIDGL